MKSQQPGDEHERRRSRPDDAVAEPGRRGDVDDAGRLDPAGRGLPAEPSRGRARAPPPRRALRAHASSVDRLVPRSVLVTLARRLRAGPEGAAVHLGTRIGRVPECPATARRSRRRRARRPSPGRAARDRRGLRRDPGAGRLARTGRAPPLGVSPATSATTWPRSRTRANRPAAHQCRPGAHRQGLPDVRRPPRRRSSRCPAPSAGRSSRSSTARSTSTTSSAHRPPAGAAHPPGRDGAVPVADPVDRAARRARPARPRAASAGVIASTGRVEQRIVELPSRARRRSVARPARAAQPARGRPRLTDGRRRWPTWPSFRRRASAPSVAAVVASLLETVIERARGADRGRRARRTSPASARTSR